MPVNQTGYGLAAHVVASNTFPNGFTVTAFPDDRDPLEAPPLQVNDTGVGLNGHLVYWGRASAVEVALSVLTNSDDDLNLEALEDANRVALNKPGAQDIICIVIDYPNGQKRTLRDGVMVTGPVLPGIQQSGRYETRTYRFRFENLAVVG